MASFVRLAENASPCPRSSVQLLGMPVVVGCVFAFLIFCWFPASIDDPDLGWHLRNAQVQWTQHAMLHQDLYSWTAAGAPWIDHEWLSEFAFYLGWVAAGARGVYLLGLLTTECVLLGVFLLAYRKSRNLASAALASTVAVLFATVSFGPRTLLFGWLCLVAELLLLDRWWVGKLRDRTALVAFPALFGCWVNLHGSWLIGLMLFAGFVVLEGPLPAALRCRAPVSKQARGVWHRKTRGTATLAVALALSIAALFANPYGARLVLYPFDLAFQQKLNVNTVDEWRTLDFHTPRGKVLLLCLGILLVAQIVRRPRWRAYELLFLLVGVYAGCVYARFLFLTAILAMPVFARVLALKTERSRRGITVPIALLHASLIAGLVASAILRVAVAPERRAISSSSPSGALAFLHRTHLQGRLFNEYAWGGSLEWNAPGVPVFIDSRVDIFERNGTLAAYLNIVRLHGIDPVTALDRYGVRYVLFERDAPLLRLLQATRGWRVLYADAQAVLLEREVTVSIGSP